MTEQDSDKLERWLEGKTALTREVGERLLNAAFEDETLLRQRRDLFLRAVCAKRTRTANWGEIGLRIRRRQTKDKH